MFQEPFLTFISYFKSYFYYVILGISKEIIVSWLPCMNYLVIYDINAYYISVCRSKWEKGSVSIRKKNCPYLNSSIRRGGGGGGGASPVNQETNYLSPKLTISTSL